MKPTLLPRIAATGMVFLVLLLMALPKAHAQTETVLYNFCSVGQSCSDGAGPYGPLTVGWNGNFYGTTGGGGANDRGVVFGLYPEPPGGGCESGTNTGNGWCEFVLYSFCSIANCADGAQPQGNVAFLNGTIRRPGNLYGTTSAGGVNSNDFCPGGCGTVFEIFPEPLSPPGCPSGTNGGNGWCETVLYNFCSLSDCADGLLPRGNLVEDSAGNLYGTVAASGVFELSPSGSGEWTEALIYPDDDIESGLAIDSAGNLYAMDAVVGAVGNVFKLSYGENGWAAQNIHTFEGAESLPGGPPALDNAGNVYGTTIGLGSKNRGMVWKLIPVTKGKDAGTYKLKNLHSFTAEQTGWRPQGGVTLDSSGNIYGTADGGSAAGCGESGCGVVFELALSDAAYTYNLLWNFNLTDGVSPASPPFFSSSGSLYGVAGGGAQDEGVVYELIP